MVQVQGLVWGDEWSSLFSSPYRSCAPRLLGSSQGFSELGNIELHTSLETCSICMQPFPGQAAISWHLFQISCAHVLVGF